MKKPFFSSAYYYLVALRDCGIGWVVPWLRGITGLFKKTHAADRFRKSRRFPLQLEALEPRLVPNAAPTASNLHLLVHPDTASAAFSLADHGSDPDGDALTVTISTPPAHGTVTQSGPGWVYTPEPSYSGYDSFLFKFNDGLTESPPAIASINVVNLVPVAPSYGLSVLPGQALAINPLALAADGNGDPLTLAIVSGPSFGTLTNTDGVLTYTSNSGYIGSDTITYKVNNGFTDSLTGTISIAVTNVATTASQTNGPLSGAVLPSANAGYTSDPNSLHQLSLVTPRSLDGPGSIINAVENGWNSNSGWFGSSGYGGDGGDSGYGGSASYGGWNSEFNDINATSRWLTSQPDAVQTIPGEVASALTSSDAGLGLPAGVLPGADDTATPAIADLSRQAGPGGSGYLLSDVVGGDPGSSSPLWQVGWSGPNSGAIGDDLAPSSIAIPNLAGMHGLANVGPDGDWSEGFPYWNYLSDSWNYVSHWADYGYDLWGNSTTYSYYVNTGNSDSGGYTAYYPDGSMLESRFDSTWNGNYTTMQSVTTYHVIDNAGSEVLVTDASTFTYTQLDHVTLTGPWGTIFGGGEQTSSDDTTTISWHRVAPDGSIVDNGSASATSHYGHTSLEPYGYDGYYLDGSQHLVTQDRHFELSVTGTATLLGSFGSTGAEDYGYTRSSDANMWNDIHKTWADDDSETDTYVTAASTAASTSWTDSGSLERKTLSDVPGNINDFHDVYAYSSSTGIDSATAGNGTSLAYSETLSNTRSGTTTLSDIGSDSYYQALPSGVMHATENFTAGTTQTLDLALTHTEDWTGQNFDYYRTFDCTNSADNLDHLTYTATPSFSDSGTITRTFHNLDLGDGNSWDVTSTNDYSNDRDADETLIISGTIDADSAELTISTAGTIGHVASTDDITDVYHTTYVVPAASADLPDETATENDTYTFNRSAAYVTGLDLEETSDVLPPDPNAGYYDDGYYYDGPITQTVSAFSLTYTKTSTAPIHAEDTSAETTTEAGNAADDVSHSTSDTTVDSDTTLSYVTLLAAGGYLTTLDQTIATTFSTANHSHDTSDDILPAAVIDPNADWTAPAETSEEETDNSSDSTSSGSTTNTHLHKVYGVTDGTWFVTQFTAQVSGSDTSNSTASTSDTTTQTGNGPADITSNLNCESDLSSATHHSIVSGSGSNYSNTVDGTESSSSTANQTTHEFSDDSGIDGDHNPATVDKIADVTITDDGGSTDTSSELYSYSIQFAYRPSDGNWAIVSQTDDDDQMATSSATDTGANTVTETGNGPADVVVSSYSDTMSVPVKRLHTHTVVANSTGTTTVEQWLGSFSSHVDSASDVVDDDFADGSNGILEDIEHSSAANGSSTNLSAHKLETESLTNGIWATSALTLDSDRVDIKSTSRTGTLQQIDTSANNTSTTNSGTGSETYASQDHVHAHQAGNASSNTLTVDQNSSITGNENSSGPINQSKSQADTVAIHKVTQLAGGVCNFDPTGSYGGTTEVDNNNGMTTETDRNILVDPSLQATQPVVLQAASNEVGSYKYDWIPFVNLVTVPYNWAIQIREDFRAVELDRQKDEMNQREHGTLENQIMQNLNSTTPDLRRIVHPTQESNLRAASDLSRPLLHVAVNFNASVGLFISGSQFTFNVSSRRWYNSTAGREATAEEAAAAEAQAAIANRGNTELGSLIQEVAGNAQLTAAQKATALVEGASRIHNITFQRISNIPGTQAVFRGAAGATGETPILAVLNDGRILRGTLRNLIQSPADGVTQVLQTSGMVEIHLMIILSKYDEEKPSILLNYELAQNVFLNGDLLARIIIGKIHSFSLSPLWLPRIGILPCKPFDMCYLYHSVLRVFEGVAGKKIQSGLHSCISSVHAVNIPAFKHSNVDDCPFYKEGLFEKYVQVINVESTNQGIDFDVGFACDILCQSLDEKLIADVRSGTESTMRDMNDWDTWLSGWTASP